jgi:hypothetical protein
VSQIINLTKLGAVSQFEHIKPKKECHARLGGHPEKKWIPAFAGMTLSLKLRHYKIKRVMASLLKYLESS